VRINAAARENGLTYGQLMAGLKAAGNPIDRKQLADLAVTSPAAFAKLAKTAAGARPAPVRRAPSTAAKAARPKARAAAAARA
jgi:large subunit ribosomal protein L20